MSTGFNLERMTCKIGKKQIKAIVLKKIVIIVDMQEELGVEV